MSIRDELRRYRASTCHGIVIRQGEMDACNKETVGFIDGRSSEEGCVWPACAYHLHRYGAGRIVPLWSVLDLVRVEPALLHCSPVFRGGGES